MSNKKQKTQTKRKTTNKKIIVVSAFLSVVLIFACFLIVETIGDVSVSVTLSESGDLVNSYQTGESIYIMLPERNYNNSLRICPHNKKIILINNKVICGDSVFTDYQAGKTEYTLICGLKKYNLYIIEDKNIATVFINTESGSMDYVNADKSNKESAKIKVFQNGKITIDSTLKSIKGRGNSTWQMNKKPYNITFDQKTDFLGLPSDKKFCLLSNPLDLTNLRNAIGFYVAEKCLCSSTMKGEYCTLYLNGEYAGLYYATQSIGVDENKVDISNLEKQNEEVNNPDFEYEDIVTDNYKCSGLPNTPENYKQGYILEIDRIAAFETDDRCFLSEAGQMVSIKSPDNITEKEMRYIMSLYNDAEEALYSENGTNNKGKHYSDYFNMDSVTRMFITQEILMSEECGVSSFFLYVAEDNKLTAGPIWDLDFSLNINFGGIGVNIDSSSFVLPCIHTSTKNIFSFPSICSEFFKHEDFRERLVETYAEIRKNLTPIQLISYKNRLASKIETSGAVNYSIVGAEQDIITSDNYHKLTEQFNSSVTIFDNFINSRFEQMDKYYNENLAAVFYYADNGGSFMTDEHMLNIGDTLTLKNDPEYTGWFDIPEGKTEIIGWSTLPGGNGIKYKPGDSITVSTTTVKLYAIWN